MASIRARADNGLLFFDFRVMTGTTHGLSQFLRIRADRFFRWDKTRPGHIFRILVNNQMTITPIHRDGGPVVEKFKVATIKILKLIQLPAVVKSWAVPEVRCLTG